MKEEIEPGVSVMEGITDRRAGDRRSEVALRITFGDPGGVADSARNVDDGSRERITLTIEQEAQLRTYFQSSAAFFALLDIWLRAQERGEAQTPKQLTMLLFATRVLCTQHEDVAPLLQKLVN
jgi:hypothetical protein